MNRIIKYEPWIFYLAIVLNLVPILFTPLVFSLDGPEHVYNASILKSLLTGSADENVRAFMTLNPIPVPNTTGHLLLGFFQFFTSPVFSEKLLLITILLLLPLAFRYLVLSFKETNVTGTYFIFALTYNVFQTMGFYNFLIALVPAFYLWGYLVRNKGKRPYLATCILLLLVYLSHGFVYLLCLLVLAIITILQVFRGPVVQQRWKIFLRKSIFYLLAALPSLILFFCFSMLRPELFPVYLTKTELWKLFTQNQSLVCYMDIETSYTKPLLWSFLLLGLAAFVKRCRRLREVDTFDLFPFLLLVMVVLLLVLPDSDGWGGYYTLRTLFFINLFLLLWAATGSVHRWIKLPILAVMLFCHTALVKFHYQMYDDQQLILSSSTQAGFYVEKDRSLLTFNVTGNWLYEHVSSRVAAVHGALNLCNYEPAMQYFPLVWKQDRPEPAFEQAGLDGFIPIPLRNKGRHMPIDYIFVLGRPDVPQLALLKPVLDTAYDQIFDQNGCYLYKIKK